MKPESDLQARLRRVLEESESRRSSRLEERTREMEVLTDRLDRFAALTGAWLRDVVAPRLETLAAAFPNARRPRMTEGTGTAVVEFGATDELPASCEVCVSFAHDPAVGRVHAMFRARIIPVLMEYEREGVLALEPREEERAKLEGFLDDRLCQFAEEYLRIREPNSPYQKDQTVVDPVCGMALRRWEAAATLRHGDHTYCFCMEECRRRFESEPGRYVRG